MDQTQTLPRAIPQNCIAFVNGKSGGCLGQRVISKLKKILPPQCVYDLMDPPIGPMKGLINHVDEKDLKVVCCGGDGTVGWVLSVIDKIPAFVNGVYPTVAVIPLGTGNDLSRILRWGTGYGGEDLEPVMDKILNHSSVIRMDRWKLTITDAPEESFFDTKNSDPATPPPVPGRIFFEEGKSTRKPLQDSAGSIEEPYHPLALSMPARPRRVPPSNLPETPPQRPLSEPVNKTPRRPEPHHELPSRPAQLLPNRKELQRPARPEFSPNDPKQTDIRSSDGEPPKPSTASPASLKPLSEAPGSPVISPRHPSISTETEEEDYSRWLITPTDEAFDDDTGLGYSPNNDSWLPRMRKSYLNMELELSSFLFEDDDSEHDAPERPSNSAPNQQTPPRPMIPLRPKMPSPQDQKKDMLINNYFSIGIDSKVALSFHTLRNNHPQLFSSKFVNMAWYGGIGVKTMIEPYSDLTKVVILKVDKKVVPIPRGIKAIILLNIPSYAGGTDPWGITKPRQSINDKVIEIVGLKGAAHVGAISAKVSSGVRIGQGTELEFFLRDIVHAQVDGEPFFIGPTSFKVEHFNQANMSFNNYGDSNSTRYNRLCGRVDEASDVNMPSYL